MPLNITKVAVGCDSVAFLAARNAGRLEGETVAIWTRYRPTRWGETIGGSLYWIIKHRIVARQAIIGFEEDEAARKWRIRVDARLVPVRARPKRAHQGWRYLEPGDAPDDFDGGEELAEMPVRMVEELTALALL